MRYTGSNHLCGNCKAELDFDGRGLMFDEYKENIFCDYHCFKEWATDNIDVLIEYYRDLNVFS